MATYKPFMRQALDYNICFVVVHACVNVLFYIVKLYTILVYYQLYLLCTNIKILL